MPPPRPATTSDPIVIDTRPMTPSPPRDDMTISPGGGSFIFAQRDAMREIFRNSGISLASYSLEVLNVARAAAAEGDYTAAFTGYKLIGQHLGAIQGEKHLHLHAAVPAGGDLRAQSDAELRALIEQARQESQIKEAEVIETEHTPAPEQNPNA